MNEEIPQVFFLGAGEYHRCIRVKLLGRKHRGHGIEIRIYMAGDDGQGSLARVDFASYNQVAASLSMETVNVE